jgi:hypothetical protein
MKPEEIREKIETVIDATFSCIKEVYGNHREGYDIHNTESCLLFPKKRVPKKDKTPSTRISEQELRFIFVEKFIELNRERKWGLLYSVETPTQDTYRFSKTEGDRQSANFDLVIHDGDASRIALIEFKANNQATSHFTKDFDKLNNPQEKEVGKHTQSFFIFLIEKDDEGTYSNLHGKIKGNEDIFYAFSLKNGNISDKIKKAPLKL